MQKGHFIATGFALLAVSLIPAVTQAAAPPDAGETITVHGLTVTQLEHVLPRMAHAPANHQIARWEDTLHPCVFGLKPEFSEIIEGHLKAEAERLHVKVKEQCDDPNVLIIASESGAEVVRETLDKHPNLALRDADAAPTYLNNVKPTDADIQALKLNRPVRWYCSSEVKANQGVFVRNALPTTAGFSTFPALQTDETSALGSLTHEILNLCVVVVDINQATGVSWGALSDYIAMAVLAGPPMTRAQPDLSVLSLFQPGSTPHPKAITAFDRTVLNALYTSDPKQEKPDQIYEMARAAHRHATPAP